MLLCSEPHHTKYADCTDDCRVKFVHIIVYHKQVVYDHAQCSSGLLADVGGIVTVRSKNVKQDTEEGDMGGKKKLGVGEGELEDEKRGKYLLSWTACGC